MGGNPSPYFPAAYVQSGGVIHYPRSRHIIDKLIENGVSAKDIIAHEDERGLGVSGFTVYDPGSRHDGEPYFLALQNYVLEAARLIGGNGARAASASSHGL